MDLNGKRKIHFIGICGVGISAIAKLLKDSGHIISGSDSGSYAPTNEYLRKNNIEFNTTYDAKNIPRDVDAIVLGTHMCLEVKKNPEIKKAKEMEAPLLNFPDILNLLTKKTHNIICTGSSGKSTCSSIVAHCLEEAKKSPSFFIGATLKNFNESAKIGKGKFFVLEGDEYPISPERQTSKFTLYNSKDVIISSMAHDHLNIFKTAEDYEKLFFDLVEMLGKDSIIAISKEKSTERIRNHLSDRCITYSANDKSADWYADDITYGEMTTFTLKKRGEKIAEIKTKIFGDHNIENIVGAAAMLLEKNYITAEEFAKTLENYEGIKRRLEKVTQNSKIEVYEGFGSSAEKVRAAIEAIQKKKKGRIVVLFEPHAISWRLSNYLNKYKGLFDGVDEVYVYTPVLEKEGAELKVSEILKEIGNVKEVKTKEEGVEMLKKELKDGDTLLALSSGYFDGILKELISWLEVNRTN